jgi:3-phenylpropionate/cinnamic acid dioxygenase small subunit
MPTRAEIDEEREPQVSESSVEITNLIYTYAEYMDAGDFSAIGAIFEHAAISVEGSDDVISGKDEIVALYHRSAQLYPDTGTPKTKHVITNAIVNVEEDLDAASSRSYFIVLQAVEGVLALQPILAGRYRQTFERVEGIWRFKAIHIIWDLVGDLSSHMIEAAS